jgi:polyphosphate kinase
MTQAPGRYWSLPRPVLIFPGASASACFFFRVTRGAKDDPWTDQADDEDTELSPGAIIGMVTAELTARRYAGVVRLEVSADMPTGLRSWLAAQLGADPFPTDGSGRPRLRSGHQGRA